MSLFKTKHEKRATVKTALILALMLICFYFVGLSYLVPPPELGIEINFGTSAEGYSSVQPLTTETPKNVSQQSQAQEVVAETKETVLTQEEEEAPVINESSKPTKKTQEQNKPKTEAPKPDQSTSDALNSILGAPSTTNQSSSGHGDSSGSGDKGQIDGNPYANAFFGGGTGNGTGFGLNGRRKQSNQSFIPNCDETGRVVVQIEVDKTGKVIKATPGVKGSTNTASCLMEPAKKTALSYRFNSDANAPNRQIGFVVVEFRLGAQ